MAFLLDVQELKPGLILFRRGDVQHRNWYCRIKLPRADRYKTVSLQTADINAARERAFDDDADLRFRIKHDVPVFQPAVQPGLKSLRRPAEGASRGWRDHAAPLRRRRIHRPRAARSLPRNHPGQSRRSGPLGGLPPVATQERRGPQRPRQRRHRPLRDVDPAVDHGLRRRQKAYS